MNTRTDIPQLLGYQVADRFGMNIQGDHNDPSGLASFEIMDLELADHFAATHPGFLLMPIRDGDIGEATVCGMGAIGNDWENAAKHNHDAYQAPGLSLETPRMLVLSTAHITHRTSLILDGKRPGPKPLLFQKGEYGWIIPIIDKLGADSDEDARWICPDLLAIRKVAESAGCTWIMLDRDADTVDGLPTYDW